MRLRTGSVGPFSHRATVIGDAPGTPCYNWRHHINTPKHLAVMNRPGRNDPCRCGSGRKSKRCCLASSRRAVQGATSPIVGKFRFEAGSYGGPGASYAPSIICYRREGTDRWDTHFCLVRGDNPAESEAEASETATSDLRRAFAAGAGGSAPEAVALSLRGAGYVRVTDFRMAVDQGPGFAATAQHDPDRGPVRSIPHAASWTDEEGMHLVAPGTAPSPEQIEAMTQAFRTQIRESPLFDQMVRQFGRAKSEELLKEIRGKLK